MAKVGDVANAEQVGVEYRDAFHAANCLKHERGFAHAPLSLHHDVLPRFHVSFEDARELGPAAEVFTVDGFPVFERIHDFLFFTVLHYAVLHYAILHNEGILPNHVASCKGDDVAGDLRYNRVSGVGYRCEFCARQSRIVSPNRALNIFFR